MLQRLSAYTSSAIWLVTGLTLTVFLLAFADVSYKSRQDSWLLGEQAVTNVAKLAEQSIAREIQLYNLSLQAAIDGALDPRIMGQDPELRAQILFDRSATADGLGSIVVIDRNGSIYLDSKSPTNPRVLNVADRDFFKTHTDEYGDNGLFISLPFKARSDEERWTIALSRRISGADGSFKGVVSGFIKVDYLNKILQRASLGSQGIVSIQRDDGVLIARSIFDEKLLALDWRSSAIVKAVALAPDGLFAKRSLDDNRQRLYAYRRIGGTSLIITTGLPVDQVLGVWWSRTIVSGIIIVVLTLSVILLVSLFKRELVRRADAEHAASLMARTDGLTGIANRRMFDEMLQKELRRAARHGNCVSLLMLDVDWFKKYNDAYGHLQGDRVLADLARVLSDATRNDVDLVARYGGEEFAIILTHKNPEEAELIAERILRDIDLAAIPFSDSVFARVTMSCGIASNDDLGTDAAVSLIEEADRCLYEAKKSGRNRFVVSPRIKLNEAA